MPPQPVGRYPGLSDTPKPTLTPLTWGQENTLVLPQGSQGAFRTISRQLVHAQWPRPCTWTLAAVIDFTGFDAAFFVNPLDVLVEWTIGVGQTSATIQRRLFSLRGATPPFYPQIFDQLVVPAERLQGRVTFSTTLPGAAPNTAEIMARLFCAPRVFGLHEGHVLPVQPEE